MKSDGERVLQCTTGTFEGVVASVKPQESWVAKFSRIENFIPGAYALRMTGQLDQETQEALEEAGRYIRGRPEDD
ncbi:uncharacterized protein L969DRAFT_85917 [Mixia osmundae IAM 14324]|nr:uncharacterized protein L969DRAFT_85917 [Mixia osmundae IAM 14324]KEI40700.1 hypothetical protein L969DRAFT_85917 [Mixia osmundae IAM 14324]